MTLQAPPNRLNSHGKIRQVGVEIEFAGLPPRDTAMIVRELFGGELNVVSPIGYWLKIPVGANLISS